MVSVPTQEEFDALLEQVQLLELKVEALVNEIAAMGTMMQFARYTIDALYASLHPT